MNTEALEQDLRVESCQDTIKGMAKLHGFQWGNVNSILVDLKSRVITNPACAKVTLWHNPRGADTKILEVFDG